MQELAQKEFVQPICFAFIYGALGEFDEGFNWLEKAVDEHAPATLHIYINPVTVPLRSHPRYRALLRKMNLEP